ncbi:MAG: hypothetical protein R2729_31470 [Bryobacteraceae bacterium]
MRHCLAIALLLIPAAPADTPADLRSLVKASLQGLNRETELREKYLYNVYNESIEFDSSGKTVKRTETAWEMVDVDGVLLRKLTARGGKPISDAERAAEETSLKARAAEWNSTPPEDRPKARRAEHMAWLQEFPEALDYTLVGDAKMGGRDVTVLAFEPRPGYKPRNIRARVFEKMRGKLWIDKSERELVRVEAEMFDDVNIAFGLFGKIAKGTQFALSRRHVGEKAWLVDWQRFRFDARILLVKSIRRQEVNKFDAFRPRGVEAARLRAQ